MCQIRPLTTSFLLLLLLSFFDLALGRDLIKKGSSMEPFAYPDVAGKQHSLSEYRGKVLLVNFWATWCPPCVHEIPSLVRLKDKMAGRNFEIVALNVGDQKETVESFLAENRLNFTVLLDTDFLSVDQYRLENFPSTCLVDQNGKVQECRIGAYEWDNDKTLQKIENLLQEKK